MSRAIAALALTCCFVACQEHEGSSRADSESRLLRLLEHTADVQLSVPDQQIARSTNVELYTRFDQDIPEPWYEGRWEVAHARGDAEKPRIKECVVLKDETTGTRALALGPASRGLHACLPAAPGPMKVRVRARKLSERGVKGTVQVQTLLRTPPPLDFEQPMPDLERMRRPWGLAEPQARIEFAADDDSSRARDFTLALPWDSLRRGIRASVVVPEGGLWIEEIEITALGALDTLEYLDQMTERRPETPLFVGEQALGEGQCPSLRLLPGWTITFPLTIPRAASELRGWIGAVPSNRAVDTAMEIRFEDRLLGSVPVTLELGKEPRFQPFRVDLTDVLGKSGDLSLRSASSTDDVVLAVGSPVLAAAPAPGPRPPNVVLISLDTLRADALGCYGQSRPLSPVADRWAAQGVRFAKMSSPSSYTLPAHATMMTGQNPMTHQVRIAPSRMHPTETRLLAEVFRDAGYATAAFTGGGFLHPLFGFHRGFDAFLTDDPGGCSRRFGDVNGAALEQRSGSLHKLAEKRAPVLRWIEAQQHQPFFLFVHTFFVHNYTADPSYLTRIDPALLDLGTADKERLFEAALGGDQSAARKLRDLYDATVLQTDVEILGAIEDQLLRLGIWDDTVIALVSDHGEEFLEHGVMSHGYGLWNTLVRVPWILRGRGVPSGVVRNDLATLEDLASTLLGLADLAIPPSMQGVDRFADDLAESVQLLDLDTRVPEGDERWDGITVGETKLLRDFVDRTSGTAKPGEQRVLLYDHRTDPHELIDLSSERPEQVLELLAVLGRVREERTNAAPKTPAFATSTSQGLQDMLERLGYAEPQRPDKRDDRSSK